MVKALSLGADDYLAKPVMPEELRLRLESGIRLLRLEIQEDLILSMAKLAEYRSDETGYHLERVQHFTRTLARDLAQKHPQLGISGQMAEEFARVSPLHDIGGGQLLKDIHSKSGSLYLKIGYEVAMYHHEKYNGKGYPEGLKGEDIPVAARIVALADMYDAMTSERCYKQAFSHEKAKQIIIAERGEHLDPKMVDSFLAQEEVWLAIFARFSE